MNAILFLSLLSLTLTAYDHNYHKQIVEKVNRLRTTWTAKLSNRDIEPLCGLKQENLSLIPFKKFSDSEFNDELPENFDSRTAHPYCETIGEIRDQSKCGSCWAFSGAEVMSDRLCIHSKGKFQTRVSAQHLITCCKSCGNGCFGGSPFATMAYWKSDGIPSGGLYGDKKSCKPYFLPPCDDHMHKCHDYQPTPKCEDKCIDEYPKTLQEDLTFAKTVYGVSGEKAIMKEIYENGPVTTGFTVYEDFADYEKGIYQHVMGKSLGAHAVKLIGWGVENGVKYWIIVNSWNETWGEKGTFRMLRGVNECGIERSCAAALPKLE